MRRWVEIGLRRVVEAAQRAAERVERAWPGAVRRALIPVSLCVVFLVAYAAYSASGAGRSTQPVEQKQLAQEMRYSVICSSCGERTGMAQNPIATLARQNGRLQCPNCQAFAADWHRRGSLSIPVGEPPAQNTAEEGPGTP
jgi:hypothetical protein